jgi:hypothetical protein
MKNKYVYKTIALVVMVIIILTPGWAKSQENSGSSSSQNFNKEELTQMLAPIALYPDALLSQVLMAASYPFEVVEADRFLEINQSLHGDALDNALKERDWDVSVLSLCYYPKVLSMMNENLNWTARLGDAFVNQQQEVMDTVQELRAKAYARGNITTTQEQNVIVEERIIRIETVSPDYMYVPVYDPYVIYGPWWYPTHRPFPIFYPGVAVIGPRIVFSPRVYVGFGVFGWSAFNWHDRNVVFVNIDRTKRFNRHVNVYRGVEHSPWRSDREKRFVREQRSKEIPRYRHPVRPIAPVGERRPGVKIKTPLQSEPERGRKPFMDRDKGEKRELPDRKIDPRTKNIRIQPPAQIQPTPERKPLDRAIEPRNRKAGVQPPDQIQASPERRPLDRKIETRDRNAVVQQPAQIQPRQEKKNVSKRDKGEKERGESDREGERGSGSGREGRR